MTTATPTTPATLPDPALDPVLARAQFFFDLELAELRVMIPQAQAEAGVAKY